MERMKNLKPQALAELQREDVAVLTGEMSPAIVIAKLIAKHGHAEVFTRHGPVARVLHRASRLWILGHESAADHRGTPFASSFYSNLAICD
jgi:hypothetical protein